MARRNTYIITRLWNNGTWDEEPYDFPELPNGTTPTTEQLVTKVLATLSEQLGATLSLAIAQSEPLDEGYTDDDYTHPNLMAYPIYGADDDHLTPGLYLVLWNGRRAYIDRDELDDQGFDGPIIGPLENYQTTYGYHLKLYPSPGHNLNKYFGGKSDGTGVYDLHVVEDELEHDGCYYGDWSAIIIP